MQKVNEIVLSLPCCRAIASRGHGPVVVSVNGWYGACGRARAGH